MDSSPSNKNHISPEDEDEERRNFACVVAAFKYYRSFSNARVNNTEVYLNTLPQNHQFMLRRYRHQFNKVRDSIDANHRIIMQLIKDVHNLFSNESYEDNDPIVKVKTQDLEKVQITLKQLARDWSDDGAEEREQCYKPIIDEIIYHFNPDLMDASEIKVLVPGAGLGRLTYEVACRGYYCEGNEFSLFMLIASNFVLNRCVVDNQYTIYPYVHQYVNNLTRDDQITPVQFPDVSPVQAPPKGECNMVAGDFLQVYTDANDYHCVATCFFIDCANNVLAFIENIYKILKPGGIWVNLGPLLYHFSDVKNEGSIEPTYEDLIEIVQEIGFELLKNNNDVRTKYAQNPRSMQQSEYHSVFFVCRKPMTPLTEEVDDQEE